MNKKMLIIVNSLIFSASSIIAGGFEGENQSEINLEDWTCEYCLFDDSWDIQLDAHLGSISDDFFRYANYTGHEDQTSMFFSGDLNLREKDGSYWLTSFENLGLDSASLQSSYGRQGSYGIELDYLTTAVRKDNNLMTPFANPNSNQLQLNSNWIRSDDALNFTNPSHYNQFSLSSDWDRLGIKLDINGDNNFDYTTSYRRLQKKGLREMSAAQIVPTTYLPFAIDQVTEDISATVNYLDENWFASFAVIISKFDNQIDSVNYETPFLPLFNGSGNSTLSANPDNKSTSFSINARYSYAARSFAKIRYITTKLTQDQSFLPYTTNQNLLMPLSQSNLNGEVATDDVSIQINHWFSTRWSLRAKYRYRDRDNKSDQLLLLPVVNDTFVAASLMNLPYDFSKESGSVDFDYRLPDNQMLSLSYKTEEKTRNFQTISKTKEEGFSAKYRATFFDNLMLIVKTESFDRDSSAPQLIDFLNVSENPLMQRFNVSDRIQNKFNVQLFYTPVENFSTTFSGYITEQDYHNTDIGLTYNEQQNLNLDFNWHVNETVDLAFFMQREEIETDMAGSNSFSTPNWQANNFDEVKSYGFNIAFKNLLDGKLELFFDYNRSDADSLISLNKNNVSDQFPEVSSLWSEAALKMKYYYSEQLTFALMIQQQKFESNDYAIDGVVPGSLSNLLTFGAMSNSYDLNYLLLSASYQF